MVEGDAKIYELLQSLYFYNNIIIVSVWRKIVDFRMVCALQQLQLIRHIFKCINCIILLQLAAVVEFTHPIGTAAAGPRPQG